MVKHIAVFLLLLNLFFQGMIAFLNLVSFGRKGDYSLFEVFFISIMIGIAFLAGWIAFWLTKPKKFSFLFLILGYGIGLTVLLFNFSVPAGYHLSLGWERWFVNGVFLVCLPGFFVFLARESCKIRVRKVC